MEKTKYRIVGDEFGFRYFLQYLTKVKFFFFFETDSWVNVPRPFCDVRNGTDLDIGGWDSNVTAVNPKQLEDFIKENPYIDKYLEWYNVRQKALEDAHYNFHAEIEQKRSAIKNFKKEF